MTKCFPSDNADGDSDGGDVIMISEEGCGNLGSGGTQVEVDIYHDRDLEFGQGDEYGAWKGYLVDMNTFLDRKRTKTKRKSNNQMAEYNVSEYEDSSSSSIHETRNGR
ncbi:hypothetical protein AX774_g4473 [Zancudomyces culisetae]|uniref:Uncharacterized protein n=1 Tax=Zancudomyces culisetae TaxID=1213189 RepID=A0A1R1PM76_ZANCU|nr:hypothetical protein AX774_g4473 [Zancudomyces culisetae]|eukprot:OMH82064.1 hypothetical protein AX774_g4473 [Zancudomyces culisetae]